MNMYLSKSNLISLSFFLFLSTFQGLNAQENTYQNINTEVSANSKAFFNLEQAVNAIGHRLSGSTNGNAAENFVDSLFRVYNLPTSEFMPFEINSWNRKEVSLKVQDISGALGGVDYSPLCVSLAHSPLKSNAKARIVDLGNGLKEDFENLKSEVKGNIVLMNIGIWPSNQFLKNLHRSEKVALAVKYGAKGVMMINTVPGDILLTGTASVDGDLITIPAVCISFEDGQKIRGWMIRDRREMLAKIAMANTFEKSKARNIIATIPGSKYPNEWIVIGAHLDSWDLATGAVDNGIGAFAVIDMARTFAALDLKPERTIKFVCFMGEEQGLYGSHTMVNELKGSGDIDKVKVMINLDMAGNPKGYNAFGNEKIESWLYIFGNEVQKLFPDFPNTNSNQASLHSDHQYFMMEGIPIISLNSNLDPSIYKFYHSNKDNFELVNKQHLENTVRYTSMLLYALSNEEKFPAKKLDDAATRDMLIRNNLKEQLQLGKEWKWEN